jgi:hypothetical protein
MAELIGPILSASGPHSLNEVRKANGAKTAAGLKALHCLGADVDGSECFWELDPAQWGTALGLLLARQWAAIK